MAVTGKPIITPDDGIDEDYAVIGTWYLTKPNNAFECRLVGSPDAYSTYLFDGTSPYPDTTRFNAGELTLELKPTNTSTATLAKKVILYVDDFVVASFDLKTAQSIGTVDEAFIYPNKTQSIRIASQRVDLLPVTANGYAQKTTTGEYRTKTAGLKYLKVVIVTETNDEYATCGTISFVNNLTLYLNGISLDCSNAKTEYSALLQESFDYSDLKVFANYYYSQGNNYAATEEVTNYTITTPDLTTAGSKIVTVTFNGNTANYTVNVGNVADEMKSNNLSDIFSGDIYTLSEIDLSGLEATVSVNSQEVTYTGNNYFKISLDGSEVTTSTISFPDNADGQHTIRIEVAGVSATKTFAVTKRYITSITATAGENFKSDYIEGQRIDRTGLSVVASFNNNTTADIDDYKLVDEDGNEFGELSFADQDKKIIAKYGNFTSDTGKTVDVSAKAIESISINHEPTKTSYRIGEKTNYSGLVIAVEYNTGDTEYISFDNAVQATQLSFSPLSSGDKITDVELVGTKTITVEYSNNTTTFEIELVAPVIKEVKVTGQKTNFTHLEDGWSEGNRVVTVKTTDDYEYTATSEEAYDNHDTALEYRNGVISSPTGSYDITVYAKNRWDETDIKSTKYSVTISPSDSPKEVVLGEISEEDRTYFVGDEFNYKGVYFTVTSVENETYKDTTHFYSTNYDENNKVFRSAGRKNVQLYFKKDEFIAGPFNLEVIVKIPYTDSNPTPVAHKLAFNVPFITRDEVTINFGEVEEENGLIYEREPFFKSSQIVVINGKNNYVGNNASKDCVGYMEFGVQFGDEVIRTAKLVSLDDPINPIEGDGNIVVTYPHYVEGYADRINKSQFGIIYNNRLFVSGNPDLPNCDWHSGDINIGTLDDAYENVAKHDYSYFSDLDYCYYGNEETAIVGYDIFRDGDLIVVKQGSRNQATLYRRSFKLTNAMSYDGALIENQVEESFPMFDINSNGGEGGISHRTVLNFRGETLVLTRTGLKAISTSEEVKNNAKYSVDVSTHINPMIINEEIQNAHMFSFKNKLLLKTSRGVYVGYYELRQGYEYEWYFLDNIDADMFFEYDNELYFANNKGEIMRFPTDIKYKDITRTNVKLGGATIDITGDEDSLICSKAYNDEVKNGNQFHLFASIGHIHANLGRFVHKNTLINNKQKHDSYNGEFDNSNVISIYSEVNKDLYYDGRVIYFDDIDGVGLAQSSPYYLEKRGDEYSDLYAIMDAYGNEVDLSGIMEFRMSYIVGSKQNSIITDEEPYGEGKKFKLKGDHNEILDLIQYGNEGTSYSAIISHEEIVVAYYVTIPYSFGSLSHSKTVWSWTFANDTSLASYVDIGYLSSTNQGKSNFDWAIKTASGSRTFEFGLFQPVKVQFNNDLLPHIYVRYRTIPTINFIRFVFQNDKDSDMVLSEFELVYSISQFTRGSK